MELEDESERPESLLTVFKKRLQPAIDRVAKHAHGMGLTPNTITILGFLMAIVSAVHYGLRLSVALAAVFCLLSGFCDALDGAVATLFGESTAFGGFLDSLLDRYSDAFIILGIIIGRFCEPLWGLPALIGTFMVSYARARAEAAGVSMSSIGLAERADRVIIISVSSFLTLLNENVLSYGMVLLAVLTQITVLQRLYHVWKVTKLRRVS
ncbi:MAG: archaetidylinositol phosphate synthase [Candidatus Bathyarchaeia archaeon]